MGALRDRFARFLTRPDKGIRSACEACGTNKWIIPDERDGLVTALPVNRQGMVDLGKTISAYVTVCENCGNVRMHASVIVEKEP